MCDCKNSLENKLLDLFKQNKPAATNHSTRLMGYTLTIGNQLRQVGYTEAEQTATFQLKTGGEKQRKTKINVIFTYCPFCGTKYENDSPEAANKKPTYEQARQAVDACINAEMDQAKKEGVDRYPYVVGTLRIIVADLLAGNPTELDQYLNDLPSASSSRPQS